MSPRKTADPNAPLAGAPIPQEEIQPLLLGILKAFDAYCRRNDLIYFADSGTLLGAVRHHGFIPWDDDIDVTMPQESYRRLLALAENDPFLDDDHRFEIVLPNQKVNPLPFVKVVDRTTVAYERVFHNCESMAKGLWVDVFCLCHVDDDPAKAKKAYRDRHFYNRISQLISWGPAIDWPYRAIYPLMAVGRTVANALGLNNEYWVDKVIAIQESAPDHGRLVANLTYSSGFWDRFKEEDFDHAVPMAFEDMEIPVPCGYDDVLRTQYGDYMTLPPVDQRVGHHGYDAYFAVQEVHDK